ncbi:MAG: hypothetical protein Q9216_005544 [Gyalolechia sp. 2 TL-2023]
MSVSSSLAICQKSFNEFIAEVEDQGSTSPEGLCLQDWEDERCRLRLWASDVGAHRRGLYSLKVRLMHTPNIQTQIIALLDSLLERLQDARRVLVEGEDSDLESIEDSSSESDATQSEIQQLRRSVRKLISCLFKVSTLVQEPAQHGFTYRHVLPQVDRKQVSTSKTQPSSQVAGEQTEKGKETFSVHAAFRCYICKEYLGGHAGSSPKREFYQHYQNEHFIDSERTCPYCGEHHGSPDLLRKHNVDGCAGYLYFLSRMSNTGSLTEFASFFVPAPEDRHNTALDYFDSLDGSGTWEGVPTVHSVEPTSDNGPGFTFVAPPPGYPLDKSWILVEEERFGNRRVQIEQRDEALADTPRHQR